MMTNYETLLKLIETVKPDDTGVLDEIDTRTWLLKYPYKYAEVYGEEPNTDFIRSVFSPPQYTRSRDALKAIRPEGYISWAETFDDYGKLEFGEHFNGSCLSDNKVFLTELDFEPLPTEELAELHAIIQAIEYERNKK